MKIRVKKPKRKILRPQCKGTGQTDTRKQLFNEGIVGTIEKIQVSTERIVQLNGIMFDLDPGNYMAGPLIPGLGHEPKRFYERVVRAWLGRHPVLTKSEVRITGTGLHALLWFDSPIKFEAAGDRERWAGIVKVVQAALPIDPDQPGITATTRAVGSINSKNRSMVRKIRDKKPVTEDEVLGLFHEMCSAPFKTVLNILGGGDFITPCPVCGGEDTKLSGGDYGGFCYGSCGKVKLEQLYDLVLARPKASTNKKDRHGKKGK